MTIRYFSRKIAGILALPVECLNTPDRGNPFRLWGFADRLSLLLSFFLFLPWRRAFIKDRIISLLENKTDVCIYV